jgi:hypothetical protein
MVKQNKKNDLVIVIYRYFTRSWSGTFCSDVVQLLEKHKVAKNPHFEKWDQIEVDTNGFGIFIDKNLKTELEINSKNLKIDARTWKLFGKYRGSFSLEIEQIWIIKKWTNLNKC